MDCITKYKCIIKANYLFYEILLVTSRKQQDKYYERLVTYLPHIIFDLKNFKELGKFHPLYVSEKKLPSSIPQGGSTVK